MKLALRSALVAVALPLLAGCAVEAQAPDESAASTSQAYSYSHGYDSFWELVGISLNGRSLGGYDLSNLGLIGVSLDGVTLGGRPLRSTSLDGTVFHGAGARAHGGPDFVGATFSGMLANGDSLPLRIDSVDVDRSNLLQRDVFMYGVSYFGDSSWRPLCGVDAQGAPVKAIPLAGRWDYRAGVPGGGAHIDDPQAFTFACMGFAIAKCVELGYKPWLSFGPMKGAAYHQACTRALRADFCGDGTSYTQDGERIDLYDGYGFRTPSAGWPFEAEWNADGALCASRERVPAMGTPTCWARLQSSSCGASSDFRSGALLMTQDAP